MTAGAAVHGHTRWKPVASGAGSVRSTSCVTAANWPPPAPRSAQNGSSWRCSSQSTMHPSARHRARGDDQVRGEAMGATEDAEAAAERQAGDPDSWPAARGYRATVGSEPVVDVGKARPGAHGDRALRDRHLVHAAHIDDDAGRRRASSEPVAAAAPARCASLPLQRRGPARCPRAPDNAPPRADARRQSERSATCAPTRTRPSPRQARLRRPSSLEHGLRLVRRPQARCGRRAAPRQWGMSARRRARAAAAR
jgi:hypothetical protein